jgi:hypothetical protein
MGGTREPQWPSRREGALARTGLSVACVAVDPTAANALTLSLTRSRPSRNTRAMLHAKLLVPSRLCSDQHISDPKRNFLPTQVAVAQLLQPVPFGHPRFIRSYKIVWRGAAPCSVVR